MKFLLFPLLALCSFTVVVAQSPAINKLAANTSDLEERTSFNLSGSWLDAITKSDGEEVVTSLNNIQLLSFPDHLNISYGDLSNDLYEEGFEILTETRSGTNRTHIMVKENQHGITDLVLLAKAEEGFTIISLSGLIVLDELGDLDIDIDGWDNFQ